LLDQAADGLGTAGQLAGTAKHSTSRLPKVLNAKDLGQKGPDCLARETVETVAIR